jgi:cytochrome P450
MAVTETLVANRLDLNDPSFLKDRRASYQVMRQQDPYAETELNGEKTVVLTRFKDIDAVLRHRDAVMQPAPGQFPSYIGTGAGARFYRSSLPSIDAPEHTQVRRILSPTFNPQSVARMEAWVAPIIENRLNQLEQKATIDVVQQLGDTIPVDVACRLLNIPRDEAVLLVARVNDIVSILSQAPMTAAQVALADAAAQFYYDYFGKLMEERRNTSEEDFVGLLIQAEKEGALSRDHVCTVLMDVFIASYHTTMVSFSNAINALACFPTQREALRSDPSLAPRAWDETLRYDAPVHFRHRYVREPVQLEGYTIEPGVKIMLALASANWDETRFAAPEEFDLSRTEIRHMAFGGGGHFCLGSPLSRLEGKLFLPGFLKRYPNFKIVPEQSSRNDNLTFPYFEKLTIEVLLGG